MGKGAADKYKIVNRHRLSKSKSERKNESREIAEEKCSFEISNLNPTRVEQLDKSCFKRKAQRGAYSKHA